MKEIEFIKTYIIVSGSLSKDFFIEFEKLIDEIKVCPIIIIFTSTKKLNLIKKNIISLDKFSLFDINLVFDEFTKLRSQLLLKDLYQPHYIAPNKYEENNICFSFEYINELKDLIFPLTFIEFMEIPNKIEIIDFNQYLLDKYSNKSFMKNLIEQLLIDVKIPFQILVKYWIRAYTFETLFYKEMNYSLQTKIGNEDYDIYIRTLYQGLSTNAIKPLIDETLYRGSIIQLDEINKIKESLNNKKEDLPGCICYNKAFLSSSLDRLIAFSFMIQSKLKGNARHVLYVFKKGDQLDKENATNADIQEFSSIKGEREILFFPYSCFEITEVKEMKEGKYEFFEIYLNYLGKYKTQINKSEKIPENDFTKAILSSNILEKNEMNKESNKTKFDFNIEKYITPNLKESYIIAVYDITNDDINKKIQILNCEEKANKDEIKKICDIYLDNKIIDFTFEYIFNSPGKYTFMFKFKELLTNANKLFCGCCTLISLNFSKFKSNYIKDMTEMFCGCSKLESLDLSNFKTKEIFSMNSMFKGCNSLKNVDLSSFDTNNVIDMSEMFSDCNSLTLLGLSNFKTHKVKSMSKMFYKCSSLFFINLSNFQSNNINNISEMFSECTSLNYLDLSIFEIGDNINTENMFYNCPFFEFLKKEFISEITDNNINDSIEKICNEFLSNESKIISKYLQNFTKTKKYENIEILNQSIIDYINTIKNINILVLGETGVGKTKLIKAIINEKKGNLNQIDESKNYYQAGLLKLFEMEGIKTENIEKILPDIESTINDSNKKGFDSMIHFILFCITGITINNNVKNILNKLINKYENRIPIFIIYLNSKENEKDSFIKFNENLSEIYINKKLEIINVSFENIDNSKQFDEIFIKIKNNFNTLLYKNIHDNLSIIEIVKNKIEKIEDEKDLNELPISISKYFEKLLGKRDDIVKYLEKHFETLLNYSKRVIDTDTITNFIDNFKQEKLKLKVKKSKKIDIENLDEELNKELKKKYYDISKNFYEEKFNEEFYKFFLNFMKTEAEKIIVQSIKDLKMEDLKPFIEKKLEF